MPVAGSYRPCPVFPTLGPEFFDVVAPARFPLHRLRHRDQRWAARIGLETLDARNGSGHFAAFEPLPGNLTQPLALRYHGHQFRVYNPELGDGRGFLYAQLRDAATAGCSTSRPRAAADAVVARRRRPADAQGRRPRGAGDRDAGSARRPHLAVVLPVRDRRGLFRGDEPSPTRSWVLVRLGHTHMRFGTFQRCAYPTTGRLRVCSTSSIEHYPRAAGAATGRGLPAGGRRGARGSAPLDGGGVRPGVLNTDNMNITGESFDYGPWRFLPTYDPEFIAAYFDPPASTPSAGSRRVRVEPRAPRRRPSAYSALAARPRGGARAVPRGSTARRWAALLVRLGVASRDPDWTRRSATRCIKFLGGEAARSVLLRLVRRRGERPRGRSRARRAPTMPARGSARPAPAGATRPLNPARLADPYSRASSVHADHRRGRGLWVGDRRPRRGRSSRPSSPQSRRCAWHSGSTRAPRSAGGD